MPKEGYIYHIHRELFIPSSIKEVWAFFSSPFNLEKITPAQMGFKIIEYPDSREIFEGMLIKYKIRPLMNIPIIWVTRIDKVLPQLSFVDTQLKGPYALWEHLHSFNERDGGVLMADTVRYSLPFGILGSIVNALVVEQELKHIFDYREKTINEIFKP